MTSQFQGQQPKKLSQMARISIFTKAIITKLGTIDYVQDLSVPTVGNSHRIDEI